MSRTTYHLVGIGGAGMSALARVLLARGESVTGSDQHDSPALAGLRQLGARIAVGHHRENLNGANCLVVSAAVPEANPEVVAGQQRGLPILTRAALLGRMMAGARSVAVTGTHGKSTTSAMLASLLLEIGLDPTILLGADLPAIGGNARAGRPDLVVAEVCEAYDSFLETHPTYAVLTNVEADHLDYYGTFDRLFESFQRFVGQVDPAGGIAGCGDDARVAALMATYPGRRIRYGFAPENDLVATSVESVGLAQQFSLKTPGGTVRVRLGVPGRHNVLNAMGALAAASLFDIPWDESARAISAFRGIGRRLERVGGGGGIEVYDDYAHHPTEIRAALETVRAALRPNRLIALFQPHLYSRTQQFMDAFARSFDAADMALFMEIYAAREAPIAGVSGRLLADRADQVRPDATTEFVDDSDHAMRRVLTLAGPGDVVVCMGAGDITHTARAIGAAVTGAEGGLP